MWKILFFNSLCLIGIGLVHSQRVAPGVPPQHYEQYGQQHHQQPPQYQQQQHQQQQFQQQQQQQQFQQVPHHQQPPPPQHQQPPPQQGHGHGHHHGTPQSGQILNAANIAHEKEHIQEHMDVPIDTSKMTDQELQFHYFKMHDADNNNKLDGCELIKSLIHWHEQGSKDPNNPNRVEDKIFKDEELENLINPILSMDDTNKDGYIDYPEFVRAQQKAAANTPQK